MLTRFLPGVREILSCAEMSLVRGFIRRPNQGWAYPSTKGLANRRPQVKRTAQTDFQCMDCVPKSRRTG